MKENEIKQNLEVIMKLRIIAESASRLLNILVFTVAWNLRTVSRKLNIVLKTYNSMQRKSYFSTKFRATRVLCFISIHYSNAGFRRTDANFIF